MKELIAVLFCILAFTRINAQGDNPDQVLDVLNTSTIPAFIVMGVSSTEIARPANIREFTGSIQNATSGLNSLPVNYAIEFLINKDSNVTDPKHCIGKNMSLSFGYTQDPAVVQLNSSRLGAGFKIPIFKNKVEPEDSTEIERTIEDAKSVVESITAEKNSVSSQLLEIKALERFEKSQGISSSPDADLTSTKASIDQSAQRIILLKSYLKSNRGLMEVIKKGLFIEASGGVVLDIPGNVIQDIHTSRFGGWLTVGYERVGPFTGIGIVRVLREPRLAYLDANEEIQYLSSTPIDFGGRIALNAFKNKLDAGGEIVWRKRDTEILKKSTKILFHFAYKIGKDDKLSFSFGKDFDNNVDKSGNVVSLVNFIKSIGAVQNK